LLDRERILEKLADLESYLRELEKILPESLDVYLGSIEKRRATERILQLSIEVVIDICAMLVSGLKLGIPGEEDDLFDKLKCDMVISEEMRQKLQSMRGFRNILVHEYTSVDNQLVFEIARDSTEDFQAFKSEVLGYLDNLS